MRIGLMGGTFRPIHYGHLIIAENAREQLHLDEVWFIPNHSSPFKVSEHTDDADDRIKMVELAIQNHPYFKINTLEIERSGISYSYQTLEWLHEHYPEHEFFFIMGGDSLEKFETWYYPEIICQYATLAVAIRNDNDMDQLKKYAKNYQSFGAKIVFLETPNFSVSSSELRDRIAQGKTVRYQLPDAVIEYIRTHHLYQA